MHGFGLHFLLKTSSRKSAARLAFSRPLKLAEEGVIPGADLIDTTEISDKFAYIECLNYRDKFAVGFFKKYGKVIENTLEELTAKKAKKCLENT